MKIIFIHRADFDKRPPVISSVYNLLRLNYKVTLITTGITQKLRLELENRGGEVLIARYKLHTNIKDLILRTFKYRQDIKKILSKYKSEDVLLWIEGNYTFSALIGIVESYNYILQIQELHKNKIEYLAIKRLISSAKLVFMPEYNRSFIYKCLFNLQKTPYVIPNKPDFIPNDNEIELLKLKYPEIVTKISNKKIILYQGILCGERDLTPFLKAVNKLNDDYLFVLMGKDYGVVDEYKKVCNKVLHIPFISAPDYLFITSMAYIGIVTYVPDSLNTIYCAPNKLYEYSAFSLPVLANDIPGLKYPINKFNMGLIIDEKDEDDIIRAIQAISENYCLYSKSSSNLYSDIDNIKTIKIALESIKVNNE